MALCQLNRASVAGDDKRPRLEHLRESGQIEEDAENPDLHARLGNLYFQKRDLKPAAEALSEAGLPPQVVPARATGEALVEALAQHFERSQGGSP